MYSFVDPVGSMFSANTFAWARRLQLQREGSNLMSRVKNDAVPADLVKPLRSNLRSLCMSKVTNPDNDEVATEFETTIMDLLSVTLRPNLTTLEKAVQRAFSEEKHHCRQWSRRILDVIKHCKDKRFSATSGKKLNPAVWRIAKFYDKELNKETSIGQQLMSRARQLQAVSPKHSKTTKASSSSPKALLPFAST